jgi:hypothetical protein
LSELADYRKIHGHCNVPQQLKKHQAGCGSETKECTGCTEKESIVYTTFRIQALEAWFRMGQPQRCLGDRLSELADYRKIHGTAMFLTSTAKTSNLGSGSNPRIN